MVAEVVSGFSDGSVCANIPSDAKEREIDSFSRLVRVPFLSLCHPTMIRLVWDFFGPDARGTAMHHAIHLREFMTREGIEGVVYGQGAEVEGHFASWCEVEAHLAPRIAKVLRPQRQGSADGFRKNALSLEG